MPTKLAMMTLLPIDAVMGDVDDGHQQAVVADPGHHAAALGAGIDGDVLADDAALADHEPARLAAILEVLRLVADRGEGKDARAGADLGPAGDRDVRDELDAVVQHDVVADHRVGADLDVDADLARSG